MSEPRRAEDARARRARSANLAYIAEEFDRAAAAFHEARLTVVALKGVYLSQAVYADMAMRPFSDADILCREADLPRVFALLQSLGYRPPTERLRRWYERCYHNTALSHAGPLPFLIDVHWALAPRFRCAADMEGVFARSVPWKGEFVRALAPEDMLLHLAVHAAGGDFRLSEAQWRDFETVLARMSLDEEALLLRARRWGAQSVLHAALFLAARHAPPSPLAEALARRSTLSPRRRAAVERAAMNVSPEALRRPGWRGGISRERTAWKLSDSKARALLAAAWKAWTRLLHGTEPLDEVRRVRENLWTRVAP